ncbi:acyltransferase [Streptococcus alactolyticus]|uniref:Acyltransferase n=1 Tax=Streptococcus alactolyticus TaxID=29389 RepID=A0ABY7LZP7_STRAY|nr:acyltransferase [Streptococcus alactolyticus]WBB07059.1 acyltransferase [Streptococcus alactolyticus]
MFRKIFLWRGCIELSSGCKLKRHRYSNIELLRIISMILIVAHHFSVHGGFDFSSTSFSVNRLYIQFLAMGGKIGVDIFVIISGYFLITSNKINIAKVLKFWLQILFYSVVIYAIFVFAGNEFSIKELIQSFFPIIFQKWWFASTYFVLYLLSPYLNRLLNSFSKGDYQKYLLLLTVMWCIIPTFTTRPLESNNLIWFIYLYSLAAYIRLHKLFDHLNARLCILTALFIGFLTYLSAVLFDILGLKFSIFSNHATYFFGMQMLPILLVSIFIFIGFSKINIGYVKWINVISSATFGVYLIHDNRPYIRDLLWKTLFNNTFYSDSNMLILYSIGVTLLVYITCTIMELGRIYLLEKNYMTLVNRFSNKLENILRFCQNFIFEKL